MEENVEQDVTDETTADALVLLPPSVRRTLRWVVIGVFQGRDLPVETPRRQVSMHTWNALLVGVPRAHERCNAPRGRLKHCPRVWSRCDLASGAMGTIPGGS